jgi:predicted PurR-regulated permease PerM
VSQDTGNGTAASELASDKPVKVRAPIRLTFVDGALFGFGLAAVACLVYFGVEVGQAILNVVVPFIVGTIVAILLDPLVLFMERNGVKRIRAVVAIFVMLFLVTAWGLSRVAPLLMTEGTSLVRDVPAYLAQLRTNVDGFLIAHKKFGPVVMPKNYDVLTAKLNENISAAMQASSEQITTVVSVTVTAIVQCVIAIIVAFYMMVDLDRIRARAYYLVPKRGRNMTVLFSADIGQVFSDYVRGLVAVCALYGVATCSLLFALSFAHGSIRAYSLLIGVAAGILYAIPYVGALTTALVTFLVCFVAGGTAFATVAVMLTFGLNQVFDYIVTPKVVGGGVGLHPVVALFAMALGAELFHFWGLLFSVPLAGSIQAVLFRLYPRLKSPTPNDCFNMARGGSAQPPDVAPPPPDIRETDTRSSPPRRG